MNASPNNGFSSEFDRRHRIDSGEETLRLIAGLPAPVGLVDRVQSGLRNAPQTGRVLRWRSLNRESGWMHGGLVRGAAAAAIVCVVAGGGWTVYSRVSPASTARVIEMPQRVGPGGGGFAPAGARRVPETLQGPTLTHPVVTPPDQQAVENTSTSPRQSPAETGTKKKKPAPKASGITGP